MEEVKEEEKQTKPVKINFFKKIWYSITKISKYEEMRNQGVGKSIKYFFGLIALLCIFIGVVATILQTSLINNTFDIQIQNASPIYYFIIYFLAYFLVISLVYALYIIIISLYMWGITKIIKQNWGFKKSLMNTIYASTLSIIINVIYMVTSYLAKYIITYFDVISVVLIFIYILALVNMEKKAQKNKKQI